MLRIWQAADNRLVEAADADPASALWLDLVAPTGDERERLAEVLGLPVPDPVDMASATRSRRLRRLDGSLLFTIRVPITAEGESNLASMVLILGAQRLVSLVQAEPAALEEARARLRAPAPRVLSPARVLLVLLEELVEDFAEALEAIKRANDQVSRAIFAYADARTERPPLRPLLNTLGRNGDLLSDIRESAANLQHLLKFWQEAEDDGVVPTVPSDEAARRARLARDIGAVVDRTGLLRGETALLLNAAMGFLGLVESEGIRVLTLLATLLMPPTLIASIYGMNFQYMPELEWTFGYPLSLLAMVASSLLFYWWFRRRGLL